MDELDLKINVELKDLFESEYRDKPDNHDLHELFKEDTKKRFGRAYDFNESEKNLVNFTLLEW